MEQRIRDWLLRILDRPLAPLLLFVLGTVLSIVLNLLKVGQTYGPVGLGAIVGTLGIVALIWYAARFYRVLVIVRGQRSQYENALGAIASRQYRPVRHQKAELTYEIGRRPAEDRITEAYITAAGDGTKPLLWFEVRVSLFGSEVPKIESLRELRDVKATQAVGPEKYRLNILPAGRIEHVLRGMAIFSPQIDTKGRPWEWSFRWPVWNPLRSPPHEDILGWDVLPSVTYESLRIKVVFPEGAVRPRVLTLPGDPPNRYRPKLLPRDSGDSRSKFIIDMNMPQPGHYSWQLTIEGFER